MTQMAEICRAVPDDFLVLSRRRRADAAADGDRRARHHLRRVERGAGRDGADGRSGRARRLRDRAPLAPEAPAADADQLRRVESRAREVRDGGDGPVRGVVPAADGAAEAGVAGQDPGRAEGVRPADRRRPAPGAWRRSGRAEPRDLGASSTIARLFAEGERADKTAAREAFFELQRALGRGEVRAAEPDAASPSGWRVNAWVKQGILLGFRFGDVEDVSADHGKWPFYDKDTMTLKKPGVDAGVRIVPGGSTIRDGAFVARASSACRRCTSTSAPTSTKARSSTRTRSSDRARRSAGACT